MSDWENEEVEQDTAAVPTKSKWDDEDASDDDVADAWDAASDSESEKPKSNELAFAPPPKKKGTLKQKIAEKEAARKQAEEEKAARQAAGEYSDEEDEEEDPRERAERLRQEEIESDLRNAADLLGDVRITPADKVAAVAAGGDPLEALKTISLKDKDDFTKLSEALVPLFTEVARTPFYTTFLHQFLRDITWPLDSEEIKKCASKLTTAGNEKQREEKAAQGKKKVSKKPALGGGAMKLSQSGAPDRTNYSRFGDDYDFM
ncbi:translation initiation factor eIF3 subunit [Saitoella complicata NRRL Y-17804]|nr:translation initiation factor eIF3 subunit [Saitoella complicata NRRL Y-17804]ODQ55295.1 translation initiation factor eIF3 subunit [Saitoella complicata NRRL Y-17804]